MRGLAVTVLALSVVGGIAGAGRAGSPEPLQVGQQATPCPEGAHRVDPGTHIQAEVDREPAGVTFCLAAGRHRAQTIAPKDGQRFFGEAGAVLDGTVALTGFAREGSFWTAPGRSPPSAPRGRCLSTAPACDRAEIVRRDGAPLTRVLDARELGSGRFLIDAGGHVVVGDDPTGHRLEESGALFAFLANGARDVTVANLTIEGYGNPAQRGAVFDDEDGRATDWLIEHNDVRLNSGVGILAGPGARILANRIERNGQLGIGGSRVGSRVIGNEIAENNTRGFDPEWEAGGLKATRATGLVLQDNHVHGNHGPGLWCDIECRDTLYEGNRVEFNDGAGIFHEISFAATIRHNMLRENGAARRTWYWGADILLAASQDVRVEDNVVTVADGGTGIALVDQGRPRESGGLYRTAGNTVRGNALHLVGRRSVRMGGVSDVVPGSPNDGVIEHGDNRFEDNVYVVPTGGAVLFGWGTRTLSFQQFQALGQEARSVEVAGSE